MTQPISLGDRDPHPEWPTQPRGQKDKARKKTPPQPAFGSDSIADSIDAEETERSSPSEGDVGTQIDFEA